MQSSLICSDGIVSGSETLYCCLGAAAVTTTCAEDSTVVCPDPGSFGFSCTDPSDNPMSAYTNLTCSSATAGNANTSLYCCVD